MAVRRVRRHADRRDPSRFPGGRTGPNGQRGRDPPRGRRPRRCRDRPDPVRRGTVWSSPTATTCACRLPVVDLATRDGQHSRCTRPASRFSAGTARPGAAALERLTGLPAHAGVRPYRRVQPAGSGPERGSTARARPAAAAGCRPRSRRSCRQLGEPGRPGHEPQVEVRAAVAPAADVHPADVSAAPDDTARSILIMSGPRSAASSAGRSPRSW